MSLESDTWDAYLTTFSVVEEAHALVYHGGFVPKTSGVDSRAATPQDILEIKREVEEYEDDS